MSLESNKIQSDATSMEQKFRGLSERLGMKIHIAWRSFLTMVDYMPTTARGGEEYRTDLFPEMKSTDDVITRFQGKCVVDIGCGDTYLKPDSLINRVASQTDPKALYIGIDPAVGRLEWELSGADAAVAHTGEAKAGPGKRFAVRGSVPEIPFPKKGVDIFVSDYAIGFWVVREKPLLAIFETMEEALTDEGEVRLNPVRRKLFEQHNALGKFINDNFTMEFHGDNEGLLIFKRKH